MAAVFGGGYTTNQMNYQKPMQTGGDMVEYSAPTPAATFGGGGGERRNAAGIDGVGGNPKDAYVSRLTPEQLYRQQNQQGFAADYLRQQAPQNLGFGSSGMTMQTKPLNSSGVGMTMGDEYMQNQGTTGQSGYLQNPYLKQYGDALTAQSVQNFNQGVMPQMRAGAQAAGQYGSSRQGIAEGVAAGNASTGLGANLAQLYSQGYNTDTNSALQNKSLDNNFYTNNRQLDLSQYQIGANLTNQGITGQQNLGKGVYEGGNTYQNAPLQNLNNYSNLVNPYTGLNGSNTNTGSAGGGLNGAIGGGMTAAKLIALLTSGDPTTLKNLGLSS